MATDKHTNRVLSNVLLDNDKKSDMVEAIAHVPFSMHQYYCTPNSNFRGYNCTLKKFPVPPKWWGWGYMYTQMKKAVGMLQSSYKPGDEL